ncbi:MAG TPA: hypothetical protein DD668_11090, partial [Alphaproteobacteria bacterium]|nr:hypothetical protein [Alphaproteobacteria bacterium]
MMTNGQQIWQQQEPKLVAILRGITPSDILPVCTVLYEAGFRAIEVPLNSPEPLASITLAREGVPADAFVG